MIPSPLLFNPTRFSSVTRTPLSWYEELKVAAHQIKNSTDNPLVLCFSGGIDSEIIAKIMITEGIPFTVLTVNLNDTNLHDTQYATRFCTKYNVTQKIVNLDPISLLTENLEKYVKQGYESVRSITYMQLKMLDIIENDGGCGIIGGGDFCFRFKDNTLFMSYPPDMEIIPRWISSRNTIHYPYFHMHSAELCLAYLQTNIISDALSTPTQFNFPLSEVTHFEKIKLYNHHFPDLAPRTKFTGWENWTDFRNQLEKDLLIRFPGRVGVLIPAPILIDQLSGGDSEIRTHGAS